MLLSPAPPRLMYIKLSAAQHGRYENPGVDSYPSGAAGGVIFGANLLFSPVPEPGSAPLLLAGLAAVAAFVLRGRRSG
jgi:hypothetical protein